MLPGSGAILLFGYLNILYLEGVKTKPKLKYLSVQWDNGCKGTSNSCPVCL